MTDEPVVDTLHVDDALDPACGDLLDLEQHGQVLVARWFRRERAAAFFLHVGDRVLRECASGRPDCLGFEIRLDHARRAFDVHPVVEERPVRSRPFRAGSHRQAARIPAHTDPERFDVADAWELLQEVLGCEDRILSTFAHEPTAMIGSRSRPPRPAVVHRDGDGVVVLRRVEEVAHPRVRCVRLVRLRHRVVTLQAVERGDVLRLRRKVRVGVVVVVRDLALRRRGARAERRRRHKDGDERKQDQALLHRDLSDPKNEERSQRVRGGVLELLPVTGSSLQLAEQLDPLIERRMGIEKAIQAAGGQR